MTEYRSVLERAGTSAPPPDLPLERVLRRRDRKRRNQRLRAGVLGIAIAILAGWWGIHTITSTQPKPADDRSERLGVFEPVAGRVCGHVGVLRRGLHAASRPPEARPRPLCRGT